MKLIPPDITEGEWHFEELRGKQPDGCGYLRTEADYLEISHHGDTGRSREENLANARFLANSKRVAEEAEAVLWFVTDLRRDRSDVDADEFDAAIERLRAALLASGYTEEPKP